MRQPSKVPLASSSESFPRVNDYLESGLSIVTFSEGAGITTFRVFDGPHRPLETCLGFGGRLSRGVSAARVGNSNCSATGTHQSYVPVADTVPVVPVVAVSVAVVMTVSVVAVSLATF